MRIVKTMLAPSRDDAVRLTRSEKMSMVVLAYAATIMDELQGDLAQRLTMIENGPERVKELSEKTDALLNDLRLTIPINQRQSLQNVGSDFEMRLAPKASPNKTTVLMQKEEFRELVDFARTKCRDCIDDDEDCEKCGLYQLLTSILPLDDYHNNMLCPYNLGEWKN